jgi:DNA/RNA-binding domain of Phe-tRNA-synthetase-like protein
LQNIMEELAIRNLLSDRLSAGINVYHGLSLRSAPRLRAHVAEQTAAIRRSHADALPPAFTLSRLLYKSFRLDPTKHRPSSEALWRRLRDRGDFPAVNPLVDLTNLLSLTFQVCFGFYDLERVHPPVLITRGDAGDQYQGIRKETMNFKGKIVLRDDRGAFGNPSADSLRASVEGTSRDVLQVLFFHPNDPERERVLALTRTTFGEFFTMDGSQSFFI